MAQQRAGALAERIYTSIPGLLALVGKVLIEEDTEVTRCTQLHTVRDLRHIRTANHLLKDFSSFVDIGDLDHTTNFSCTVIQPQVLGPNPIWPRRKFRFWQRPYFGFFRRRRPWDCFSRSCSRHLLAIYHRCWILQFAWGWAGHWGSVGNKARLPRYRSLKSLKALNFSIISDGSAGPHIEAIGSSHRPTCKSVHNHTLMLHGICSIPFRFCTYLQKKSCSGSYQWRLKLPIADVIAFKAKFLLCQCFSVLKAALTRWPAAALHCSQNHVLFNKFLPWCPI